MSTHSGFSHERLLHYALWTAQALVAFFFTAMAALKLLLPAARLVEVMAWTQNVPLAFVRTLGVLELLGAVAIAAPSVAHVPRRIVGYAGLAFTTLMASAACVHAVAGEPRILVLNLAIGSLAAFVAWGRLHEHAHRVATESGVSQRPVAAAVRAKR